MTTCPGMFMLAGLTTSPSAASAHARATSPASRPITAAIAPRPTGTASCMNRPRRRTIRTASAKSNVPAHTCAEYSPRLWPATNAGSNPRDASSRLAATLTVRMAGCVFSVRRSWSSGPSKIRRLSGSPSASSASSNVARQTSNASASAFPMPTVCDPCPGKMNPITGA